MGLIALFDTIFESQCTISIAFSFIYRTFSKSFQFQLNKLSSYGLISTRTFGTPCNMQRKHNGFFNKPMPSYYKAQKEPI